MQSEGFVSSYHVSWDVTIKGENTADLTSGVVTPTWPRSSMITGTTPFCLVKSWYDMFLADLRVQMKTSLLTVSKAMYFMSGLTQQLVCPNIVSGRRVAATRKTLLPLSALHKST